MKKVYIRTYGCQMNKYDSGVMGECLRRDGYISADSEEDADVILLNTCSVREHAEVRVAGVLNSLKGLKKSKKDLILGICGCMAQKEGEKLIERFPHLDLVCGTHRFGDIARIVGQVMENGEPVVDIGEDDGEETGSINRTPTRAKQALQLQKTTTGAEQAPPARWRASLQLQGTTGVCAWVSVMRGCDNFCSYCVVPYLRGRERSRASASVLEEVQHLAENGVKEVTLLGQNIAAYGKRFDETRAKQALQLQKTITGAEQALQLQKTITGAEQALQLQKTTGNFAGLLEKVNGVDGILRIRFLTSHPRDVSDRLLEKIKELEKVCESLHFPFQAGSDKILKLMNRGYTRDYYRRLIEKARNLMPDVSITTDIIVGFPGETDKDFKETRELMEEIGFDGCFIYRYSPRPGTKADSMDGQVPDNVKQERLEELLELQRKTSAVKNEKFFGREVEVLVEEVSKKDPSSLYGRTRLDKNVVFKGRKELIGQLFNVKIIKTGPATLVGFSDGIDARPKLDVSKNSLD